MNAFQKICVLMMVTGAVSVGSATGTTGAVSRPATIDISGFDETGTTSLSSREDGVVRRAQHALNREVAAGLRVDGKMGPATVDALRRFQASIGLPVTGLLDTMTESALGVSSNNMIERAPASVDEVRPSQPL